MHAMSKTSAASATGEWPGQGPVVLCGLGRVGLGVFRLCRRLGKDVVAITLPGRQDQAEFGAAVGIRVIPGDARDETLLVRAGIAKASALIAVTDDDLANVTIALHARILAPDIPVVVRLFDQDLAGYLRSVLGIRQGYSTSALAAPSFVAAVRGDNVRTTLDLDGKTWSVEDLVVDAGSPWLGRTLAELAASGKAVLVHSHGDQVCFDPPCEHVLAPGDAVTLLVPPTEGKRKVPWYRRVRLLARTLRAWWRSTPRGLRFALYGLLILVGISVGVFHVALGLSPIDAYYFVMTTLSTTGYGDINLQNARPLVKLYGTLVMVSGGALFAVIFSVMTDLLLRTRFSDVVAQGTNHLREHIIIAGLGRLGFRVLRQLAHPDQELVVIEKSAEPQFLGPARSMASVIGGDASAVEILQRAGLAGASAVLAVTDDDLTNLSIALASKQARPDCRVVVRVFDQALAARLQKDLHIDAVVSVIDAVAPTFVGAALDRNAVHGTLVHDRLLLFVESDGVPADARPFLGKRPNGTYQILAPNAKPAANDRVLSARWIELGN
jgi:Trk K+ transport system NAD-binding subunit